MRRVRASRGFTLLETLVALAIAAIVLNGFYTALSTGSLLDRRADQQAQKLLLATTILDRVGVDVPLRIGTVDNGSQNGLEWELIISAAPTADMDLGPIYPSELAFVFVSVNDPAAEAEPVVLRAIRYATEPL